MSNNNIGRTLNYKKFYALLRQLQGADKEELVLQFTDGRTDSLSAMRPDEYYAMVGSMEATARGDGPRLAALDKARKRLIACIGGYLTAMKRENNIALIKSLACRAAEYERFNDIPLDRLASLYNAFLKRQKDIRAAEVINPDAPVMELKRALAAAIAAEQYERARDLKFRIAELEKVN